MKLRSIQVLRAVAAIGVVFCHAKVFPLGAAGVDLFFVISGFIIAGVLPKRSAKQFITDRCWRIYPLYWLLSLPWFALAAAQRMIEPSRTFASLTLIPTGLPYLRPGWTLMFEMLFYLAAACSLFVGARPLIAAFVLCFVVQLAVPNALTDFLGYPLILEFLAGAMIWRLQRVRSLGPPLLIIGIALLAIVPPQQFTGGAIGKTEAIDYLRVIAWGGPSAMILYGAISIESAFQAWAAPLVILGDASYSIYLVHIGPAVIFPPIVGVPVAILAGLMVHLLIETRLMRHSRLFKQRQEPTNLATDSSG